MRDRLAQGFYVVLVIFAFGAWGLSCYDCTQEQGVLVYGTCLERGQHP